MKDGGGRRRSIAFDSGSGEELWSFQTGSGIRAAPVTFELDGIQYIKIASGMGGAVGGYTGLGPRGWRAIGRGAHSSSFDCLSPALPARSTAAPG